jgi:sulfate adenylyltransferase
MRLADGTLWHIPVVRDVSEFFAKTLALGSRAALRDTEGVMQAVMTVEDIWRPHRAAEAELVYGTGD